MNYGPLVALTLKEALMVDLSCILGRIFNSEENESF